MRTQMHQDAFPGEDISDRPPPEDSVPGLLALIDAPSGRHRAADAVPAAVAVTDAATAADVAVAALAATRAAP